MVAHDTIRNEGLSSYREPAYTPRQLMKHSSIYSESVAIVYRARALQASLMYPPHRWAANSFRVWQWTRSINYQSTLGSQQTVTWHHTPSHTSRRVSHTYTRTPEESTYKSRHFYRIFFCKKKAKIVDMSWLVGWLVRMSHVLCIHSILYSMACLIDWEGLVMNMIFSACFGFHGPQQFLIRLASQLLFQWMREGTGNCLPDALLTHDLHDM